MVNGNVQMNTGHPRNSLPGYIMTAL